MVLLDLIALIIIILCVIKGYKKGFVSAFLGSMTYIVSLFVTFVFHSAFTSFVKTSFLGTLVYEKVTVSVNANAEASIQQSSLPEIVKEFLLKTDDAAAVITQTLSDRIFELIIGIISAVALFLIAVVIIKILMRVLNIFAKIPILKQCNRLLGSVCGFVNSMILIYIILTVLSAFVLVPAVANIMEQIDKTTILKCFYENNILLLMLK